MNRFENNTLTFLQYVFLIAGIQISVAVLSTPRVVASSAGTDGWISIVVAWLLTLPPSLLIIRVMRRSPNGTILDLLHSRLGKWVPIVFAVVLAAYLGALSYIGLIRTLLITRVWLLQNSSPFFLLLLLFIPTYIVASEGPRLLGRFSEGVFYLLCWLPIVYLLPMKEGRWLNLLPVVKEGWGPILAAVPPVIFAFLGFVVAFFLYPYLENKKLAGIGIVLASTITMAVNLLVTLVCFVYFSPNEVIVINQPVISVLKTIQFKFVERIEVIFISLYLFIYSLIWIPCLHLTAYCLSWATNKKGERRYLLYLLALIGGFTFFYMPTFNQTIVFERRLTTIGIVIEYILPVALWIYIKASDGLQKERTLS